MVTWRLLLCCALLVGCGGDETPGDLVIRAGRVFDGTGGPIQQNVRISVRAGSIAAITPDEGELPLGIRVIDARAQTVMPGLVDAHTHLGGTGACRFGVGAGVGQLARNLYGLLAAGVTTVADWAAPVEIGLGLRRWSGTGRSRGPRIMIAGPMLTAPNGYLTDLGEGAMVELGSIVEIASVEEARLSVRELHRRGVDFVKVGLQANGFDGEPLPLLDRERLCAIVEEAHKLEMRALAHATETRTYELALDCGIDGIGHAPIEPIDSALVDRVAAAGISVAPTIFVFEAMLWGPGNLDYIATESAQRVITDEIRADLVAYAEADRKSGDMLPDVFVSGISRVRAEAASMALRANAKQLHQAGVPLGLGTDAALCFNYMGSEPEELRRLVEAGLTPAEALVVATSGGARLLGLQDALGKIAPHYRADIIVVDGRPDEQIEDIGNVVEVIVDGVVQEIEAPGIGRWLSLAAQLGWTYVSE